MFLLIFCKLTNKYNYMYISESEERLLIPPPFFCVFQSAILAHATRPITPGQQKFDWASKLY